MSALLEKKIIWIKPIVISIESRIIATFFLNSYRQETETFHINPPFLLLGRTKL